MKKTHLVIWLLLSGVIFLNGCNENAPEPTLAEQVAGSYTVTAITLSGLKVSTPFLNPTNGIEYTGKIEVTKSADDKVKAVISTTEKDKAGKATTSVNEFTEVVLKKAATGTDIEGYFNNAKIGVYNSNVLSLTTTDPTTKTPLLLEAKKN